MSKKKKKSQPVIPKAEKTNIIGTITAKEIRTMQTKEFCSITRNWTSWYKRF